MGKESKLGVPTQPLFPFHPPRSTAYDGSTFWFVLDSTIANTVPCPPVLVNSFGYAVQKVLPGEDPSCGLTATCASPAITPEQRSPNDRPEATLDGGACLVNGAFAPCAASCDAGLVAVADQGGTCPAGSVCCVSPPATCPSGTTLCGNSCSNLLTDKLNCGKCGNDCTIGVADPTQASCQQGVCTCTADGVSNPYNKVKAVTPSPPSASGPGGIPCQYQTQVSGGKGRGDTQGFYATAVAGSVVSAPPTPHAPPTPFAPLAPPRGPRGFRYTGAVAPLSHLSTSYFLSVDPIIQPRHSCQHLCCDWRWRHSRRVYIDLQQF